MAQWVKFIFNNLSFIAIIKLIAQVYMPQDQNLFHLGREFKVHATTLSFAMFPRGREAVGSISQYPVVFLQPWPERWSWGGSSLAALRCLSLLRPGFFPLRDPLVCWQTKARTVALSLFFIATIKLIALINMAQNQYQRVHILYSNHIWFVCD